MTGKFIVFEGIDGAGGETQSKKLLEFLQKNGKKVLLLSYPDKFSPIGMLLEEYLKRMHEFSPEVQFLLYATDMVKDIEKVKSCLKNGDYVIADRYLTSALAYQCSQNFPMAKAIKFAGPFNFPKPDTIVYLKISPKTAIERKLKEKRSLDRNEANEKFLAKVSAMYGKLIKDSVFGKWVVVNGEKGKEEVFEDVKKAVGL